MAVTQAFKTELHRKALHLCTGAVPVLLACGVSEPLLTAGLGLLSLLALMVELVRHRSSRASQAFQKLVGSLLRPHEREGISGATWLLITLGLSVLLFSRPIAIVATLAASIGDAAAAIVGHAFGRRRIGTSRKTYVGSGACAATTAIGALLIARLPPVLCLIAGFAAAAAEVPSWPVDDNLRIALLTGASVLAGSALFN